MTPVNVNGFDMNPSQGDVETAMKEYTGDIIAMNVLGGGAFPLTASAAYVKSFDNVTRCVIGASSKEHLSELKDVFA
jgi:ketosteroid isomerase-like protein